MRKLRGEGPLGVQLSGTCPLELAQAVKIATDHGADLIDLNCGCPVKKIRRRSAGSAHLSQPDRLYQLIEAMKRNTHLPISIKIRVDGDSEDRNNSVLAGGLRGTGLDFLIVHGRNWRDNYEKSCHYDQIKLFVDSLSIPVIGNGDIACDQSLSRMLATGCAGVMISRATVGQPWLFQNLLATSQTRSFNPPVSWIGDLFYQHVCLLAEFLGNTQKALFAARTFCRYYARRLPHRDLFCAEVARCVDLTTLKTVYKKWFWEAQAG